MTKRYSLGFISQSRSRNEMRSPIWWEHLTPEILNHASIEQYLFEQEFGAHTFRASADPHLIQLGCEVVDRISLLRSSDIVISLKPQDEWQYMRPGSTLVGWFSHLQLPPHHSTQINFIDLEAIKVLAEGRQQKLLYRNASVAGECGVAQTIEALQRLDPDSPAVVAGERVAIVLGYGNLGRGAVQELLKQDFEKIIVFTQRSPDLIQGKFAGVEYRQMQWCGEHVYGFSAEGFKQLLIEGWLARADLIVNATIPSHPRQLWNFVPADKFTRLKPDVAFVDPVHQPKHGADFTRPTHLDDPVVLIRKAGHAIWYNGCNAMPSYRSAYASYIISQALVSHLDEILKRVETNTVSMR